MIGGEIGNQSALRFIADNIEDGEHIVATVLGVGEKTSIGALFGRQAGAALGGQYLIVTDRKITIIKTGISTLGTRGIGLKTKTYLYNHITSVDVSRGLLFGELEIVVGGMVEKSSGGYFSAAGRDSVFQFEKKHFDEVQQLARGIRRYAQGSRDQKPASGGDIPDQIRKLAELRDAGILTEEEFISKKRSLLDKM